jgi:hypothetical protein
MLKGTIDYFSMNFYTSYYVRAPINNLDPTMVSVAVCRQHRSSYCRYSGCYCWCWC